MIEKRGKELVVDDDATLAYGKVVVTCTVCGQEFLEDMPFEIVHHNTEGSPKYHRCTYCNNPFLLITRIVVEYCENCEEFDKCFQCDRPEPYY